MFDGPACPTPFPQHEHRRQPVKDAIRRVRDRDGRGPAGPDRVLGPRAGRGLVHGLRDRALLRWRGRGRLPRPPLGAIRAQLSAVEGYCTPGMTVFDVDANLGHHSLLAARLVRGSGASWPGSGLPRVPSESAVCSFVRAGVDTVEVVLVAADVDTGLGLLLLVRYSHARRLELRPPRRSRPDGPSRRGGADVSPRPDRHVLRGPHRGGVAGDGGPRGQRRAEADRG